MRDENRGYNIRSRIKEKILCKIELSADDSFTIERSLTYNEFKLINEICDEFTFCGGPYIGNLSIKKTEEDINDK